MTEHEVELKINSMKTKTCELDDIPAHILKSMLPWILPLSDG